MGLEKELLKDVNVDLEKLRFFKDKKGEFEKTQIIDISGTAYQCDLCTLVEDDVVGFRYMFVLINILDNHVYAAAMERKDSSTVMAAFKRIVERFKLNIKTLQVDKGTEFLGAFKEYCEDTDIKLIQYNLYNKGTMGIVERMIGIITKPLYTYMASQTLKQKQTKKGVTDYNSDWASLMLKVVRLINQHNDKKGNKFTYHDLLHQSVKLESSKKILPVGTKVYLRNQKPINIVNGKKFYGKFRYGDLRFDPKIRLVSDYFIKSGYPIRYFLDGDLNTSYKLADLLED